MLFKNITVLTPGEEPQHNVYVATKGGKIVSITDQRPQGSFGEEYNGWGKLLMPGFVNGHNHVPMTLLRGHGKGLHTQQWLETYIFPYEEHITDEAAYWASLLGIAEMLQTGTTSFSEQYMFAGSIAKAVVESGIKCNLTRSLVCFDDDTFLDSDRYREAVDVFEQWNNAGEGRLMVEFAAHGEYTTTEKSIREIAALAEKYGTAVQIHLSETAQEHEECKGRRQGRTPTRYLADCGFFDRPALVAHAVYVEEDDIRILAEKNVSVSYNPTSNMKLGNGCAPVRQMLDAGVNVALGTDGAASNNNLDMVEEAHLGLLFQCGYHRDCQRLYPQEMLTMATVNGAKAQRRLDCGRVAPGYRADLTVIDLDCAHLTPMHGEMNHLFYAAQGSDVVLTMVDGRVLYREGLLPTIDLERAMWEVRRFDAQILKKLKK